MARAIRNPIEWGADQLFGGFHYLEEVGERLGGAEAGTADTLPEVRRIGIADLREALRKGIEDFAACRTDIAFLCILYPIIGVAITFAGFHRDLVHLVFPAAAGFALLGPFAAVGAYELSRRRERGEPARWVDALGVFASPSFGAIVALGFMLLALFLAWMATAYGVYSLTLGPEPPQSLGAFVSDVVLTAPGWVMIVLGFGFGFLYAAVVLAISVVSFPLLLDRNVGLPAAVVTSVRVATRNLYAIGVWGLIVALALALGTIPAFAGLIVAMPVLGHATWHLYRRAVVRPGETG